MLKVVYFCIDRIIKIAEAVDRMMHVYVVVKFINKMSLATCRLSGNETVWLQNRSGAW